MRPCDTCKKVKDPEECNRNKSCADWLDWFSENWNRERTRLNPNCKKSPEKSKDDQPKPWEGCNDDCEHCTYKDCQKPVKYL